MQLTVAHRARLRAMADEARVIEVTNATLLALLDAGDALDGAEVRADLLAAELAITQRQLRDALATSNAVMERLSEALARLVWEGASL